jgi:hypothetical protein
MFYQYLLHAFFYVVNTILHYFLLCYVVFVSLRLCLTRIIVNVGIIIMIIKFLCMYAMQYHIWIVEDPKKTGLMHFARFC